jgi:hypothetical protein
MGSGVSSAYNSKSQFYIEACRSGNIEQVRDLLPSMTYTEINQTDADGNTGLHITCIQNNYDLAVLLLHSDIGNAFCSRTILNKQDLNAYECVRSERVRLLFARPASTDNRFIDTNHARSLFQLHPKYHTENDQPEMTIPNDWDHGCTCQENANDGRFMLAVPHAPWLIRKFFKLRTESEACEIVRNLIERSFENNITCQGLIKQLDLFIQEKNVDHLLTLYTKEMEFCKVLHVETNAFMTLLYLYLDKLAGRAFGPGDTFRGMAIVDPHQYRTTINSYRWAEQNDKYVLETRVLQSTSEKRSTAEFFLDANKPQNQPSSVVLCHYVFPNKCFTALNLQGISAFPDEAEVLILPFTLFKVTKVEEISSDYHIISLENVPVPKFSLIKFLGQLNK